MRYKLFENQENVLLEKNEEIERSYASRTAASAVEMVWKFHLDSDRANKTANLPSFSTIKCNMPGRFYRTHCSNTAGIWHSILERRRMAELILKVETGVHNENRFALTRRGNSEQLNFLGPKSTIHRLFHKAWHVTRQVWRNIKFKCRIVSLPQHTALHWKINMYINIYVLLKN